MTDIEQEIARLKNELRQITTVDGPNDAEASAAIATSGRAMRIAECEPRQAVPGVTSTGTITTKIGSFSGATQPGSLTLAKIAGVWAQIQ